MKRLLTILFFIISFLMVCSPVWADSDSTFTGTADADDDLAPYYSNIISEVDVPGSKDGPLTMDEIRSCLLQRIYRVSPSSLFKDKEANADHLSDIIKSSDYSYSLVIYREHETMFLTIQENTSGEWHVSGHGVSDEPLDHPDEDMIRKTEDYLRSKDIHNARIFFIDRINDESARNAVVFTGDKNGSGTDELFFISLDKLSYDDSGNLIYQWYDSEGGDISKAVSEYEELRDQYRSPIIQRLWIIAAAVGIILIITAVTIIYKKRYKIIR